MAGRSDLASWLEHIYEQFHDRQFVSRDPLDRVQGYTHVADREIASVIASSLAYGNVKAILGGIDQVMAHLGDRPRHWLEATPPATIRKVTSGFRYRFTSDRDIAGLLIGLKAMLRRYGSIESSFSQYLRDQDNTVVSAMGQWVDEICHHAAEPLLHLLPHPDRGSACKRLNLFLRWMCRHDTIDPGGWTHVPPAKLVIPLDVHMHRVSLSLGLTERKAPNLRTALEVTAALRQIRPDDPLRYDFALTRPGILKVSPEPR